jgi:hypothetical protein
MFQRSWWPYSKKKAHHMLDPIAKHLHGKTLGNYVTRILMRVISYRDNNT